MVLTGEIVRPGVYTIAEGERLSSVLERAGGFTDRAFLKGAAFTRAALRKTEQEQLDAFLKTLEQRLLASSSTIIVGAEKEEAAASQQALQARKEMLKLLASKVVVGRMVVQLDQPDKLKGTENDVTLIDGDTLNIRSRRARYSCWARSATRRRSSTRTARASTTTSTASAASRRRRTRRRPTS